MDHFQTVGYLKCAVQRRILHSPIYAYGERGGEGLGEVPSFKLRNLSMKLNVVHGW